MFKDAELDRLGRRRDEAFARLRAAREKRKRCGQECTRLHDDMDAAYRAQHRAYEANQAGWTEHQEFMRECSQKIEFYRGESDRCHARMAHAFAESQRVWDRGDKGGAKSFSEAGKRYQAEMRYAKEQITYWVGQSKNSQIRFASNDSGAVQSAKARTKRLKTEFDEANARLKAAKIEVEQLERKVEQARIAFDARLQRLKWEAPLQRQQRIEAEASLEAHRIARAKELFYAQAGRDFQSGSKGSEVWTKVKAGWSREHDMACTDILIFQRGVKGHHHIVLGENGQVFIDEWRHG